MKIETRYKKQETRGRSACGAHFSPDEGICIEAITIAENVIKSVYSLLGFKPEN